jgi:hypothetical protein
MLVSPLYRKSYYCACVLVKLRLFSQATDIYVHLKIFEMKARRLILCHEQYYHGLTQILT